MDFFSNARFKLHCSFSGQTPANKELLRRSPLQRAEPVAYADTSKVLPDSDPTNKKSESTVTEPRGCGDPGRESEAWPGSREPEPRLTNAGLGQRADRGHCCLTRLSVTAEDFQVSLPY